MSAADDLGRIVARLEAELAEFWAEPDGSGAEARAKVRAAILNLVRLEAPSGAAAAREELDELSFTHPGRSFLLTVDPALAPWGARAEAHAACRLDGEGTPICHDRAEIAFGVAAAERAASVVAPLALPEVSVVVEVGAGAPAPLVAALCPRADRVIVDTARLPLGRALAALRASRGALGDRDFFRREELRAAIARSFERSGLSPRGVRRLAIEVRKGEPDPALLVGWFASRLGWSLRGRSAAEREDGSAVAIDVREGLRAIEALDVGDAGDAGLSRSELLEVVLRISLEVDAPEALGPGAATLAFELLAPASGGGGPTLLRVHARTPSGERRRDVPIRFEDDASALVRALGEGPADAVYRGALETAAAWAAWGDA